MNAHLVLQTAAINAIALTHGAIGLHVEFGDDKQANAFAAYGRIGQASQHQVNNVGCQVVLARTDENLLTCETVSAIGLRLGLGAQHAQICAAVRLGQAHGAGPFTAGELGQVHVLLFFGAMCRQASMCTMRQAGVHGPSLVGRVQHFKEALIHHEGQALTAILFLRAECCPTTLHIFFIGFFETCGRLHFMRVAIQFAALFIARHIQGEHHFCRKFTALFQHRIDGVSVGLSMLGHGFQFIFQIEQFVQDELKITQGGDVAWHG